MSDQDNRNHGKLPQVPDSPQGKARWIMIASAIIIVAYLAFGAITRNVGKGEVDEIATSEFVAAVKDDRVKDATYFKSTNVIEGSYWKDAEDADAAREDGREAKEARSKARKFTTYYLGTDSLAELMADHPDTEFKIDTSSSDMIISFLMSFIPTIILIVAFAYIMNQMSDIGGRTLNFGKAGKAITDEEDRPKTKFADVAGIDEAVEELQEVRDFLSDPERYQKMGAKIPRGVLLVGPPGTGKTLLARAVAGEAGVPFFSISGSDFVEMFVGVGASRVRSLFKQAKEEAPAIIFIDEIDAVGRQRGAGLGGGHDEREQTLNQLLVEMDGFTDKETIILIAATNRPDILDPALLRPGRFDRRVTVDAPDVKGREQILRVHAANKPLEDEVDFERIAQLTPGFSGADLANLMNEAALLAARRRKERVSFGEIEEAMERVMAGPERRSRVITEEERRTIAYHESGHALVGHVLDNSDPVHKISIIARGRALGYTMQVPEEDHFLETRKGMLDDIAVLLGGRTAEELFCDDITTGASNDLERATKLAREMVTRYGMSDELGTQVFGEAQSEVFLGRDYANHKDLAAETARRIDDEVERIMREAHERAREVLAGRKAQMDTMAHVLLERETVEGEAVEALLNDQWDSYVAAHPEEATEAYRVDVMRGVTVAAQSDEPAERAGEEVPDAGATQATEPEEGAGTPAPAEAPSLPAEGAPQAPWDE